MPTLLHASHLMKFYGSHEAVHDVSLDIERGSLTAVIGHNGAGKSTTISMLIGIAEPDAGSIEFPDIARDNGHGHVLRRGHSDGHTRRPAIGVVFQQSVLDPLLTARENLETRARLYRGLPRHRVDEVIELVSAKDFAGQRYGSLSGGQRRSVDIARALINDPDLLVLDEPTTGLDIGTRNALWSLMNRLRGENGLSILLTTHYLEEAEHAGQVYLIDHGRIKASGSAEELIGRYADYQLNLTLRPGTGQEAASAIRRHLAERGDGRLAAEQMRDMDSGAMRHAAIPGTAIDAACASAPSMAATKNGTVDSGDSSDFDRSNDSSATVVPTLAANVPTPGTGNTTDLSHINLSLPDADACLGVIDAARPFVADFECRPGTMNDVFLELTK
ncbi:ABC transporter ATP-binding protein [Bifidobacterium sp. ESL0763]|uniref:ABC transporter ATP-binding protein n=1 Tax=Bifidobacterium sp. ESL0763 TaxID=2983227 RepID=UPI0023F6667C|nr:ABC transporter ATP-binding protein [Bifidobacterium sp. ESL0763]MDF7663177.1 ABC transporter ATP-binding protein [Bifidobacterium sp. ESL0763]